MEDDGSAAVESAEAARTDYPSPPDLHIAQWSSLFGTAAAKTPRLHAILDGPSASLLAPSASTKNDDFYRRASWAPDGSIILALTESQQKHVLHCGPQFKDQDCTAGLVHHVAEYKSPSPLLDAVWYPMPAMAPQSNGSYQETATARWCFAESHRDLPTRLTDAVDGQARASYAIMNHVEKYVGPHSLAFSPDLSRLYCGLWSSLAVFPLSQPGLNAHSHLPLVAGKRSIGGQRGIVSALALTVDPNEPDNELVAVGTFNGTVGIYSFDPSALPEPTDHTATRAASHDEQCLAQSCCLAGWSEIEGDGITQLKFHPLAPFVLFVASRRSDYIYVYDVRYLMGDTSRWSFRPLAQAPSGVRTAHLLAKLRRPSSASQQRIYFDIDWAGRWLATGDEEGVVHLWRIDGGRFTDQTDADAQGHNDGDAVELVPDLSWKAHDDAIGSVSFHPHEPWLLSVSGSRRWQETESESESNSDEDVDDASRPSEDAAQRGRAWITTDGSLKIWDFLHPPIPPS